MVIMPEVKRIEKNVMIDGITFTPKFGDITGTLPYPMDGIIDKAHVDMARLVCEDLQKGQQSNLACKNYAKLLNDNVDKDLACRWGNLLSGQDASSAQDVSGFIKGIAGSLKSIPILGSFIGIIEQGISSGQEIGKAVQSKTSCYVHMLGSGETIDSIFDSIDPPSQPVQPVQQSPQAIPMQPSLVQQPAIVTGNARRGLVKLRAAFFNPFQPSGELMASMRPEAMMPPPNSIKVSGIVFPNKISPVRDGSLLGENLSDPVASRFFNEAKTACEAPLLGKKDIETCDKYSRIVNQHYDVDAVCRWGKSLTKTGQASTQRGFGGVQNIFGGV
jgi:hypothetical protein